MGEITEALRRAKLAEESQDIFRDAARGDDESPRRARDWGGPAIDASDEDYPRSKPAAAAQRPDDETPLVEIPRTMTGFWTPRAVLVEPPLAAAECFRHFAVKVNRELERRDANSVLVTSARGHGATRDGEVLRAYDQSVGSLRSEAEEDEDEEPGSAGLPAASRGLRPRVHADAQEAELGAPEGRPRATHQWD